MNELLVPFTAGVIALISSIIIHWYKYFQEKTSLKRALLGEIDSLLMLLKLRKYEQNLHLLIEALKNGEEFTRKSFMSKPSYNYFFIFESISSQIGKLPARSTTYVVQFYTLVKSFLEDSINEELYKRPTNKIIEIINENIIILQHAIEVGEKAASRLRR